jgi:hypothetical protein
MRITLIVVGVVTLGLGLAPEGAAQVAGHAGKRVVHAPTVRALPGLEGSWTANFILTMGATPETPSLVVSEAEPKRVAAAAGGKISKVFEASPDPEAPALIAASDGLPIVRGERRTRAMVLPNILAGARHERRSPSRPWRRRDAEAVDRAPHYGQAVSLPGGA